MHTKTSKKIITLALALILALGIFALPAKAAFDAANWAIPELEKAQSYGLIPDSLKDVDYKKPITRIEFAAVSVKLYENLSGKTATPVATNPFIDTKDVEVLKAYNIGLTTGTSATAFSPNSLLTREQAATMLTRAIKAAYIPGWTLASDDSYTLNFAQPAKFADDGKINAWAKQSVYYANAKGIILGTGNNMFSPAANAARQEALTIAVRMVEKLKGESVDYTKGEPPAPTPTPPTPTPIPPSGNTDPALLGSWGSGSLTSATYSYATGDLRSLNGSGQMIEFKTDGTFTILKVVHGRYSYYSYELLVNTQYAGNYRVENGIIYLTNVMSKSENYHDFVLNTDPKETYDWRALPDQRLKYKFADEIYLDPDIIYLELDNLDGGLYDVMYINFSSYLNPVK